jgi:putative PLP-dependent aminotransferase (TIGR04422 family)
LSEYFLWPTATLAGSFNGMLFRASVDELEIALRERFSGAHPVVVSSGRAGLALILALNGIGRRDTVEVFPYASHCVLEAIARFTLPIESAPKAANSRCVVYHQWGYVQPRAIAPWIEDAVDSLYLPNHGVLRLGGEFELWSLPKIFGVLSGGVVWCRSSQSADSLRLLRDQHSGALRQFILRGLGSTFKAMHSYWAVMEAECGPMSSIGAGSALRALNRLDAIIADRRRKFELITPFAPDWLLASNERLPCAVPIEISDSVGRQLAALGFTTGFRHFQRILNDGSEELVRVFPVPIHQDVPVHLLEETIRVLGGSLKDIGRQVRANVA